MDTPKPFLWGPVKNALLQDIREHGPDTAVRLCFTDQQRVKEMLVQVLTDLGRDQPAEIATQLRRLLPLDAPPSSVQIVRQFIRPTTGQETAAVQNAKRIAVEVAGNLGRGDLLQIAALQADSVVRTSAVRQAYYLWRREPAAGRDILNAIGQATLRTVLPNPAGLEAVLGLSLLLYFDAPHDPDTAACTRAVWRAVVDHVLGRRARVGWGGRQMAAVRQNLIFTTVRAMLLRMLAGLPDWSSFNLPDLTAFFRLDSVQRARYQHLCRYIDTQGNYPRALMQQDLLAIQDRHELLVEFLVLFILGVHVERDGEALFPFLQTFFSTALRNETGPYVWMAPSLLMSAARRRPVSEAIYDFVKEAVEQSQQYYIAHPQTPGRVYIADTPGALCMSDFLVFEYDHCGTVRTEWIEARLQRALEENDGPFFRSLVKTGLAQIGVEWRRLEVALESLALLLDLDVPEVLTETPLLLARLRALHPDAVDDFLEAEYARTGKRIELRATEARETIGTLIGVRSFDTLVESSEQSREFRASIIDVFAHAADSPTFDVWITFLLRRLVNLVYGDMVFPQPVAAP